MSSLIKKISAKTIVGNLSAPEKKVALFSVMGTANGIKTGNSTYGEWLALTGVFEAQNLETGEVYVAPQVFLPEPMQGLIAAQVRMPNEETGKTPSIRFAVEVGYKPTESVLGYEYTVRKLIETAEDDPFADLRKALPAPAAAKPAKK